MKMQNKAAVLMLALMAGAAMSFAQSGGEAVYKARCQMCHGATGSADTPAGKAMKVKSFSDPIMLKMSDATLLGLTKNGSGKMPAFKDKLTDDQIKDAVDFFRTFIK